MKKIPKSLVIIILLIVAAKVGWDIAYPSGTWRYKMTVVVETPEGIKTGSAVREVKGYCAPKIFPEQGTCHAHLMEGEAVAVDLGRRGVLFALMRNTYGPDYAWHVVFDAFPAPAGPLTKGGIRYYRSLSTGKVILKSEQYPMFVHFKVKEDPKTVENVLSGNTEEIFGRGVRIKEVSVEMTVGGVSEEIKTHLPKFDGKPHLVTLDDFLIGDKK